MIVNHLGGGIVLIEDLLSKEELDSINLKLIEETCPVQGFRAVGEKLFFLDLGGTAALRLMLMTLRQGV